MAAEEAPQPLDAGAALGWMRSHGDRLRALVREEAGDPAPAGDPAVRAHLRFAAEAMAAVAEPGLAAALEGLSGDLREWFEDARDLHEEHVARGAGAIALEEHLQFGALPGEDPSLDVGLRRRVRIGGWIRVFLLGVEDRLGPAADGLAGAVLEAMGERQRDLARLVLSLDRQAKAAARRAGPALAGDPETLDGIGQAAVVQGHVRLMVESVAAVLAARTG